MVFYSILSSEADGHLNREFAQRPPAYFIDLNLDKIIDAITAGHEPDDIKPFFYTPLKYLEDIYYRQDIMQDVAKSDLYQALVEYTAGIKRSVQLVAKPENRYYHFQQQRWALEGMLLYCQQVTTLSDTLEKAALSSCGMMNFKHYLAQYTAGAAFTDLHAAAKTIKNKLDHIQYSLNINGDTIVVAHYEQQPNYSDEIINVFEKFKQRDVTTDLAFRRRDGMMNHIEAQILDCVARLFPAEFTELDSFIENNRGYHDPALDKFAHEIQFYLAVVEYIKKFQQSGLPFCIPEILTHNKDISAGGAFDLALAATVLQRQEPLIGNDFALQGRERIMVVSGPNQGGKTTFARMVGQLHYLAMLGMYVPARQARLFLIDNIFTHFEKSEDIHNQRGKLYDSLVRIKAILDSATASSLIIMNEIFTSTTSRDAIYLGTRIMETIIALDAFCVCVSFIDELTTLNHSIVSMMSTVGDDKYASRTYKIIRKPADGAAWSTTLVQKYRLTYNDIKAELKR